MEAWRRATACVVRRPGVVVLSKAGGGVVMAKASGSIVMVKAGSGLCRGEA
jgi:hypothetical protein